MLPNRVLRSVLSCVPCFPFKPPCSLQNDFQIRGCAETFTLPSTLRQGSGSPLKIKFTNVHVTPALARGCDVRNCISDLASSSNTRLPWWNFCFRGCSQRSSELHRAKKDIKSEVEERYLLNAEEIAQVWPPSQPTSKTRCRIAQA